MANPFTIPQIRENSMISRNSLGFQEILIWSRNYKGICQVGTRVISENFLEFLERSTPRNRSNRYHLPPEMEVPRKIKNQDRFFDFSRNRGITGPNSIFRGVDFQKTKNFQFSESLKTLRLCIRDMRERLPGPGLGPARALPL